MSVKTTNTNLIFQNEPENKVKILVDGRALCYASMFWALNRFSDWKDIKGAILYCFLVKLEAASKAFRTNRFIFCWDSETSLRKQLYPEYKAKRKHDEETEQYIEFFAVIQKEILPRIGFTNNLCIDGYEADDIIASIAKNENKMPLVIYSEDSDLYQCLKPNVCMMSVKRASCEAKPSIMTPSRFVDMADVFGGVETSQWADVKAIAGCKTDNVEGIRGVGYITAAKYLLGKLKGNKKALIDNSKDTIEFTGKLVRLPFAGTPDKFDIQADSFDRNAFLKILQNYGMEVMLNRIFWDKFFETTEEVSE